MPLNDSLNYVGGLFKALTSLKRCNFSELYIQYMLFIYFKLVCAMNVRYEGRESARRATAGGCLAVGSYSRDIHKKIRVFNILCKTL